MRAGLIVGVLAMLVAVAPLDAQGAPRLAIDLPSATDPAGSGDHGSALGPAIRTLDVLSDGQTRDLLRNGFPARLHFRLELWHTGGVFDAVDGTREWDVIVRYDPLKKRYGAVRLVDDSADVLGEFQDFSALVAAVGAPLIVPLIPARHGRRYYYNAVLDVEMLSLSDLDEVERWLRGELGPAVRGKRNPTGVVGRGVRTLLLRLFGAERRHYEVKSKLFRG